MSTVRFIGWALLGVPGWLAVMLAGLPLQLIGLVLVAVLAWRGAYITRASQEYTGRQVLAWSPWWAWYWGNEEDGINGAANGFWPPSTSWSTIYSWSALRNSTGNLRWLPFFGIEQLTPGSVAILASLGPNTWVARCGWRFELAFPWGSTGHGFWIGWRLSTALKDPALRGVTFTFQPWHS